MSVVSRRSLLASAAAALLAPRWVGAAADPEREAAIEAVRRAALGFDVLELARTVLTEAGLAKWLPDVEALIGDRERSHGLRSMMDWDRDPTWAPAMAALQARMGDDLGTKLALRRLAKRVPTDAEALSAFLEGAYRRWFGLDLPAVRAAAAALPDDGLLLAVGPPSSLFEVLYSAAREPLVRFLELVHGRRATVWVATVDDKRVLLEGLLDPAYPVVAVLGHGTWDGFWLTGYAGDPVEVLLGVLRNVHDSPRKHLPEAIAGRVRGADGFAARYVRDELREADLADLVARVGGVTPKQLVVRYTCGGGRYHAEGSRLLWALVPEDLAPKLLVSGDAVSAKYTDDVGAWEAPLEAWLADKRVALTERAAFGTCLVASAADTRGYEGLSWLPHFVEEPVPAYRPPHVWPAPAAEVAAEAAAGAGAEAGAEAAVP